MDRTRRDFLIMIAAMFLGLGLISTCTPEPVAAEVYYESR